MSDYAGFQMFIYGVPEANVEAVLDLLMDRGLDTEWGDGITYFNKDDGSQGWKRATEDEAREVLRSALDGSMQITDSQARLDIVDDLGSALTKLGVVYEMSQEPKYEYMGVGRRNHPLIGDRSYDADSDGTSYIATFRIRDIIEENPIPDPLSDPDAAVVDKLIAMTAIVNQIGEAAGIAHSMEFDRLVKQSVNQ